MIWIRHEGRRQWSQTNLPLTENENQLAACIEQQADEVERLKKASRSAESTYMMMADNLNRQDAEIDQWRAAFKDLSARYVALESERIQVLQEFISVECLPHADICDCAYCETVRECRRATRPTTP